MATKRIRDLSTGTASSALFVPAEGASGSTFKIPLGMASIPIVESGRFVAATATGERAMFVAAQGAQVSAVVWTRIMSVTLTDHTAVRAILAVSRLAPPTSSLGAGILHLAIDRQGTNPPTVRIGLENPVSSIVTGFMVVGDNTSLIYDVYVRISYGPAAISGTVFTNLPTANISFPMSTTTNTPTGPVVVDWSTAPQSNILALNSIVAASLNPANGYIRWDTGWQEAWAVIGSAPFGTESGAGTYADPYRRSYVWAYPAAFAETPNISVSEISSANGVVVVNVSSATSTTATLVAKYPASNTSFSAHVVARGRWRV